MTPSLKRDSVDKSWPHYLFWGRMRTSTFGLIVAFFVTAWLYQTYQPPPPAPVAVPETAVVPPGFVPDPEYTWVPRTNVETRTRTTTTTTEPMTTTTTTEPPTTTTPSTTSGTPTSPGQPSTTVTDPDGPGPLPPTTITPTTTTPAPVPGLPFPLPTLPGLAPATAPPPR